MQASNKQARACHWLRQRQDGRRLRHAVPVDGGAAIRGMHQRDVHPLVLREARLADGDRGVASPLATVKNLIPHRKAA